MTLKNFITLTGLPAAAIMLLALSGCTSVGSVQEFGQASREVSDSATKGYKNFDDLRTQAERDTKIIRKMQVTPADMQRLFEGNQDGARRLSALRALAGYATALEGLATKDATSEIKAAAVDVRSNLTTLNGQLQALGKKKPFTADDIGVISGLFAAEADVYVDYQRENALRRIIIKADPGVQKAARLLSGEFNTMAVVLKTSLAQGSERCLDEINNPDSPLRLEERRKLGDLAQQLEDNTTRAPAACIAVAQAATRMGEAHAQLNTAAVQGGKLTNKDTLAAVKQLVNQAKAVRELFNEVRVPVN